MPAPLPGDPAPELDLPDEGGRRVRVADLRGRRFLVTFWAEDFTPACTAQACGFRDAWAALEAAGVDVLGVSADPPARHAEFRRAEGLPFRLLSDPDHAAGRRWGAWGRKVLYGREVEGVLRGTFLVGPDGRVERAWPRVRAQGHAARVAAEIAGGRLKGGKGPSGDGAMRRRGSRRRSGP